MSEADFRIREGVVHPDPNLELDPVVLELLNARNCLIEASEAAETWAIAHPSRNSSALAIFGDARLDEDRKIEKLGELPPEELPAEFVRLIDAKARMAAAQVASQAMLDAEGTETAVVDLGRSHARLGMSRVRDRLEAAHNRLLHSYAEWGGFRYYGWTSQDDPKNYYGPVIWSEHDCVLRFALELEREFPACVHTEFKINKAMRADYSPGVDPKQSIDLVVSGLAGFDEGNDSQERFRTRNHEVFIEAKWLKKGRWTKFGEHLSRATEGISKDLANLKRATDLGRCQIGAVLVFDDECFLDFHGDLIEWPDGIERFIVSPSELKRRGMGGPDLDAHLDEIERQHSDRCARCK